MAQHFGLWRRLTAGIAAAGTVAAGIAVGWDQQSDLAPQVRLHAGAIWVASDEVGQLTLLDGASAEVAAQVQVDQPRTDLHVVQQGATGYALNRAQGSVVRVDGATLATSRPMSPVKGAAGQLAVFPTPHALYSLDTARGLLAKADPETLEPQGDPASLPAGDSAMMDPDGRLWSLDQRTGDLIWFSDGTSHSRPQAHTPGKSRLAFTDGAHALLDAGRGAMELLDPDTGAVQQSVPVDLKPDDTVAVSGSPGERRLLISVGSRGQLLSCTFDTASCAAPVTLSPVPADLGQAVEADNHAVVPDYATGRIWIVDLAGPRVVAEQRLFDHPVRFELLTRDGVVFYNDPRGDQAGVIGLDGRVRPITKYQAGQATQTQQPTQSATPPTGQVTAANLSIGISPRARGVVGDEFRFTAIAKDITSAQWTFGDGSGAAGTKVRHRYTRIGTHTVNVTAQLRQGKIVQAAAQVTVDAPGAPPRIVRINVEPGAPRVGEQVRFSAELAGPRPQRTSWTVTSDRGTETTSSSPTFQHTFTRSGTYTATLEVAVGAVVVRESKQFTVTQEMREVRCGDVITTAAVLTQDLVCGGGVALTIAADDVVLDLGGHSISTSGSATGQKGIVIAADKTIKNVTVRNGAISRFQTGIDMTNVTDVTISNFAISASPMTEDSNPGMTGDRVRNAQLRSVTINAFHPFRFTNESSVSITGSTISGNSARGVAACALDSVCTIARSTISLFNVGCYGGVMEESNASVTVDWSNVSIAYLGPYCGTTTVTKSKVSLLADVSSRQAYITGNTISSGDTLGLWNSFVVSGNDFKGSTLNGVLIFSGQGLVSGNRFLEHQWNGLKVSAIGGGPIGPLEISDNEFTANGLAKDPEAGMDGLAILDVGEGSVIKLSGNHTTNNARYGINVENRDRVENGGGNTSSGDPEGCRNFDCS
ncbi:PKD repeat protein [Kibdelosporangium banguiense]|uniref:PKD repeat protein n=1 Tax=Kibdelosporangium banguiense TaxID=1365924 RepID=A0ABS4TQR2_9PSEU|nr:PKD domain-containing protein [Kibdelosporangium banguiense]MBP2326744.1 PKD repeat protein [Kibdelosporangium banguiense]